MSLGELVEDLLTLAELAEHEVDPDRRQSLDVVRSHLADRDQGAKISEAAEVLGLSRPTVRAWIDSGLLEPVAGTAPVRIDVMSLVEVKRALDLIRRHKDDRRLLADVMRLLRDRAALAGEDVRAGLQDLATGRTVPVGDDLLAEIAANEARGRRRSKSR